MRATDLLDRKLSGGEKRSKEAHVKKLKKHKGDFEKRYGDDAESVMYAVATKRAKGESVEKEGWHKLPDMDRERYQERDGLEGPIMTRSGKVVYYDNKEGKYYDPDTDMYIDDEDMRALTTVRTEDNFDAEGQKPKALMALYKDNEHNNYHSENNLLLAKAFGTPKEVQMVELILKKNQKQGYTSNEDSEWMYKNINKKYYKELVKGALGETYGSLMTVGADPKPKYKDEKPGKYKIGLTKKPKNAKEPYIAKKESIFDEDWDDENYDITQADSRVALDINNIDDRLYDALLQAFRNEHGNGDYGDWAVTANKETNEAEVDDVKVKKNDIKLSGSVTPQMIAKQLPGVQDQKNLIMALMKMKRGDPNYSRPQMIAAADAFKELISKTPEETQKIMMLLKRVKTLGD